MSTYNASIVCKSGLVPGQGVLKVIGVDLEVEVCVLRGRESVGAAATLTQELAVAEIVKSKLIGL
jgi:hypothetical protein